MRNDAEDRSRVHQKMLASKLVHHMDQNPRTQIFRYIIKQP
jgi:hypothetical protein